MHMQQLLLGGADTTPADEARSELVHQGRMGERKLRSAWCWYQSVWECWCGVWRGRQILRRLSHLPPRSPALQTNFSSHVHGLPRVFWSRQDPSGAVQTAMPAANELGRSLLLRARHALAALAAHLVVTIALICRGA